MLFASIYVNMDESGSVVISDGVGIDSIVLSNGVELCVGDSILPKNESGTSNIEIAEPHTVSHFSYVAEALSVVLESPNSDEITMAVPELERRAFEGNTWIYICK